MTQPAPAQPTPAPPAAGPAAEPARPDVEQPVAERVPGGAATWWASVPLATRLVAITTALLALGLVLAGVAAATLLQRTLVAQVDSKLATEGRALATTLARATADPFQTSAGFETPTDYYVRISSVVWGTSSFGRRAVEQYGAPHVPDLSPDEVAERNGDPFTVGSTQAGSRWRVVVYQVVSDGAVTGTVSVALPLTGVHDAVQRMVLALVLTGIGILLIGAIVGGWAVRRSLRPLRAIETTAAAIAAGDLSQRVPAAPDGTEVGRLGVALNGMLTQIEQAFDARSASEARMRRFVADASHELRTPLATIRGYGELYRMGALTQTAQVDDTMRRIEGSATRMGGLVEDLLALARLDENRPLRREPVDLTVLAADAVSDLHALDPTRSTRLVPLLPGAAAGPLVVLGEEPRLRQVVANLLGNVVQHTPSGTPVEVAVGVAPAAPQSDPGTSQSAPAAPQAVLEVRDHGPGIDPEHTARVFERFYRVDAARGRDSGGAGLGMAIVAAIVDAHGGTVGLSRTPGGGTTVRVSLPVQPPGAGHDPAV